MSDKDRIASRELIRAEFPRLTERLNAAAREGADAENRFLARLWPRFRGALEIKDTDPALFKARVEEARAALNVMESIQEYRAAKSMAKKSGDTPDAAKTLESARARLRDALRLQGEHRLSLQAQDAQRLEERVKGLREQIQESRTNADAMLNSMIDRIDEGEGPKDFFGPPPADSPRRGTPEPR